MTERVILLMAILMLCGLPAVQAARDFEEWFDEGNDWRGDADQHAAGESLVQLVRRSIEPQSWGGNLTIEYRNGFLVVNQYEEVHQKIEKLLNALRFNTISPGK